MRPTLKKRRARQTEYRWAIFRDYYTAHGDNCSDSWCVIYGTEAEAKEMMARLNAGSDKSFHNPEDEDAQSFLYVDRIVI